MEMSYLWNPAPEQVKGKENVVVCLELPIADPISTVNRYTDAGIPSERINVIGDVAEISEDKYYDLAERKVAFHYRRQHTEEKRSSIEQTLDVFYSSRDMPIVPEFFIRNERNYVSAPEKMTHKKLIEYLEAINRPEDRDRPLSHYPSRDRMSDEELQEFLDSLRAEPRR